MNHYSWLLFDADNTLFDFDMAERNALGMVLSDMGVAAQPEYFSLYNQINKICWQAFEEGKIDRKTLRTTRFERFFNEIGQKADVQHVAVSYLQFLSKGAFLYNGVIELLHELKNSHQLALITNGLKEVQRPRLEKSGIQELFSVVVISEEIGASKPDEAFFEYTFEQMGFPDRESTLVIGDSLSADILGGHNYGTHTCWFNPEENDNHLEISPTYEIRELEELKTIL